MKTLIIADSHLKLDKLSAILGNVDYDEAVFLGDWFDDQDDNVKMNLDAYSFLETLMKNDNHHFVWGNHDLHYAYYSNVTACSGWKIEKWLALTDVMDMKLMESKFKFHHIVDNWLLTHAGLTNQIAQKKIKGNITLKKIDNLLKRETPIAIKALYNKHRHWFYDAGVARGGRSEFGGIVWCDVNREFEPIEGIDQIFGHTPVSTTAPYMPSEGDICLDTHLNHYIIMEDGVAHINSVINLV
jgi:hypothetical protein